MANTLHEIIKYFDEIAPRHFSVRDLDSYVEIGAQTEHEQLNIAVNKVVICTFPSSKAITTATQEKANLLISYYPLFSKGCNRLSGMELIKTRLLIKNYISVFILRSSWMAARGGLSDALMECLNLVRIGDYMISGNLSERVPIGRICEPHKKMNHSKFVTYVADKMNIENILFTGDLDQDLRKVLVIPGSFLIPKDIEAIMYQDVETIVTGEVTPEIRLQVSQSTLNLLELGPFVTEELGMTRLKHQMSLEFPDIRIEFVSSPPISKSIKPL
jgi:putative NIF3 family GTP cyclohydrolase 1 type 2